MENISNVRIDIENFKTFRNKATLSISDEKNVIAIIGRNASGKSSIFEAIENISSILTLDNSISLKDIYKPYLFNKETKDKECYYGISWQNNGRQYNYYIKFNSEIIKEEKLSNDKTTYFNRKENTLTLDNIKLVIAKGALHLSTFFLLSLNDKQNKNNEEFSKVYDIINSIGSNIQTYTQKHMPNFDNAVISNISNKKISEIISDADPTLISIMSEVLEKDEELNKKRIEIEGNEIYSKKIYAPYGVHYVDNNTYKLNFEEESEGTKKLFILMPTVFQILENGGYLFIDELDSSLHQDIIIDIIMKLFCNNTLNKKKAKLIFSMHNLGMLYNKYFKENIVLNGINAVSFDRTIDKIELTDKTIDNIVRGRTDYTPSIISKYNMED